MQTLYIKWDLAMQPPERQISPGVASLVSPQLQDILWSLHEAHPLLPSIFDLHKKGRYKQTINHLCLLPYYNKRHTIEVAQPLDDIRITILRTDTCLLMRLSNKQLEADHSHLQTPGPEQGELF